MGGRKHRRSFSGKCRGIERERKKDKRERERGRRGRGAWGEREGGGEMSRWPRGHCRTSTLAIRPDSI